MKGNSHILFIAIIILMALSTGCAQTTPTQAVPTAVVPTAVVPTAVVPTAVVPTDTSVPPEEVTLNVWFLSQSPEEIKLMETFAEKFSTNHPGVKVVLTPYGYDDFIKTMKLALDSGTGPDVAYSATGGLGHLAYAEAGYLVELTDIVKERGWDQRQSMDSIMYWQKELGGPIYGIPFDTTTIGVYYNKDKFNELGLKVPQTWEDFQSLLATVKSQGLVPFSAGSLDGWPFLHYYYAILHCNTPIGNIEAINYGKPEGNFLAPDFVESATLLEDWVKKGYFQDGFQGASYDDQNNLFLSRETLMNIGGTWNNSTYIQQADFNVGFFPVPKIKSDIEWHSVKSPNNVWIVSKFSTNQELAIDYIDYMLSEEVALGLWNSGDIPTYNFATLPEPIDPLQLDVYNVTQETGIGYFYTSNLPETTAVETPSFQKLADGSFTPEQTLAAMQEAYLKDTAK